MCVVCVEEHGILPLQFVCPSELWLRRDTRRDGASISSNSATRPTLVRLPHYAQSKSSKRRMLPSTPHSIDMRRRSRGIRCPRRRALIAVHPRLPAPRPRRDIATDKCLRRRRQFIPRCRSRTRRSHCPRRVAPPRLFGERRRCRSGTTSSKPWRDRTLHIPLLRQTRHQRFCIIPIIPIVAEWRHPSGAVRRRSACGVMVML